MSIHAYIAHDAGCMYTWAVGRDKFVHPSPKAVLTPPPRTTGRGPRPLTVHEFSRSRKSIKSMIPASRKRKQEEQHERRARNACMYMYSACGHVFVLACVCKPDCCVFVCHSAMFAALCKARTADAKRPRAGFAMLPLSKDLKTCVHSDTHRNMNTNLVT